MNDLMALPEIVERAFNRAVECPDVRRWRSVSVMAGCAAVRMATENQIYHAAALEGVAEEARRQMLSMMPKAVRA